jgi:glycosyltransferase involved in cell wall biosynthesis
MDSPASVKAFPIFKAHDGTSVKRLIYIGSEHELHYNKTQAMHETFCAMPVPYEFVDIKANAMGRLKRAVELVSGYWKLYTKIRRMDRGGVLWLSEFKFAPWHSLLAKLIATTRGMTLVGGPHMLAADRVLLVDSAFQQPVLTARQKTILFKERLGNALTVLFLDVIQGYTEEYIDRIRKLPFASRKPGLVFPISIPTPIFNSAIRQAHPRDEPNISPRPLKVVFWGVPTVLHGLDTLIHAIYKLRLQNVKVEATIFAPPNSFVEEAKVIADELDISQLVVFDHVTRVNANFNRVCSADVAVSHLVATRHGARVRELIDTFAATNKLLEIWALGLPALVASGPGANSLAGPGCLFVSPGNADSVAKALTLLSTKLNDPLNTDQASILQERARQFTPEVMQQFICGQLKELTF